MGLHGTAGINILANQIEIKYNIPGYLFSKRNDSVMSGTFDKRSDGATRRHVRAEKERKEKRKVRIIAVSVIAVLAVLFAGAMFMNSKIARRTLPAITLNGVNFSAAEFEYFYINAFYEYKEYINANMGDYASSMLPQGDRPPFAGQINQGTGELWSETFVEIAIGNMSELVQSYNAANAAGFTLTDESRAKMESDLEAVMMEAASYGYAFDAYLQAIFGSSMNESVFRKISEMVTISSEYNASVRDSFVYSPADTTAYYQENKDQLDVYAFRYFLVRAETVEEADYGTTEEYDAAKETALHEAVEQAELIIAGVESEDDFIAAAREYNETEFGEPDSTLRSYPGSWLGNYYGPWMMEPERMYGEKIAVEYTTGAYAVFFIGRDSNEYEMTSMRQILFTRAAVDPEEYLLGEDDPDYLSAVEEADAEARTRAESVMQQFIDGGCSEDLLVELMAASDDDTEGGLYEEISKDVSHQKVTDEIEGWLFDPARKYGDYELIETEAYGYHIVFFMGHGERYCDHLAGDAMRDRDYKAWTEGLEQVDSVRRWAFNLAKL